MVVSTNVRTMAGHPRNNADRKFNMILFQTLKLERFTYFSFLSLDGNMTASINRSMDAPVFMNW